VLLYPTASTAAAFCAVSHLESRALSLLSETVFPALGMVSDPRGQLGATAVVREVRALTYIYTPYLDSNLFGFWPRRLPSRLFRLMNGLGPARPT